MIKVILAIALVSTVYGSRYDFNLFSSEWAGSVCKTRNCDNYVFADKEWFNIHGFWPSTRVGPYPQYCAKELFNPNYLSPQTKADLDYYWNGIYSEVEPFHLHEWIKHGTCWNDLNGTNKQDDFFSTVIKVGKMVDLYQALSEASITPSDSTTYSYTDVYNAVSARADNHIVQIHCNSAYILEFHVCLDDELNYVDCNTNSTNCPSKVKYPVLHY